MSWIIVHTDTNTAVMEVWSQASADKANGVPGYKAVPVLEWLASLNS